MASSQAIKAAKAFVEITGEDSKLRKTLSGMTGLLRSTAASAGRIMSGMAQFAGGALLAQGIQKATGALFEFADQGDAIHKMAGRTGATAESLSQLAHAAGLSGTSIQMVEKGMRKLADVTTDAGRGGKASADALARVGLSASKLQDLSPEQQLLAVAQGLSQITDPGKRASLAMDLLGKSGAELLPMMEGGAAGIQAMMAEADKLGLTMSTEQVAAAAEFNDAWSRVTASAGAAGKMIGTALAPSLAWLFNKVAEAIPLVWQIVQAVGNGIVKAASNAWEALGFLRERFAPLLESMQETFGGILDALRSGDIALAARIYWLALKRQWLIGIDAINHEWQIWKKGFVDTFASAAVAINKMWAGLQNKVASGTLKVMAFFDSSINVDEAMQTLDEDFQNRLKSIDTSAAQNQQARDQQFETDISRVNTDLEEARAEWAAAVAQARQQAEVAANEPSAADTAENKFTKLIDDLRTGDIATRIDSAVKASSNTSQDLRSISGQSQLIGLINGPGSVSHAQLRALQTLTGHLIRLVNLTASGPKAVTI